MPIYDFVQRRLVLRIVYDGLAGAGKTTNLRMLGSTLAIQRMREIVSPAEMAGRTLYFDWIEVPSGAAFGLPVTCQVISVPGQVVLNPRRRLLLASADAVVVVCDSERSQLERARGGLELLRELGRERGTALPFVVQANKQDREGALSPDEVRRGLGLRLDDLVVVPAVARAGSGIVDTFVRALAAANRALAARAKDAGHRVEVGLAETSHRALERMARVGIDREGAAEMVLQEALTSMSLQRAIAPLPSLALPNRDVPPGYVWPSVTGRARLPSIATRLAPTDASGIDVVVGGRRFQTDRGRRFDDEQAARLALAEEARALHAASSAETAVLAISRSDDGAFWLWTVETPYRGASA